MNTCREKTVVTNMCQGLLTPIIRFWEMTKEDNPVTEGQINMCQGGIKKVFLKGSYKYR